MSVNAAILIPLEKNETVCPLCGKRSPYELRIVKENGNIAILECPRCLNLYRKMLKNSR